MNEMDKGAMTEKQISRFNTELRFSSLFDNSKYVIDNMDIIEMNLDYFPREHLFNKQILTEYFKRERDPSNYKYLSYDCLESRSFLSVALKNNPDIYFRLNEKYKKMFQEMVPSSEKKSITEDALDEIMGRLISRDYLEELGGDLSKLFMQQCQSTKNSLRDYLVENNWKIKDSTLLHICNASNPKFLTVLEQKDYEGADAVKEIIIEIVSRDNSLFKEMPNAWQTDASVIMDIIREERGFDGNYAQIGNSLRYIDANINISTILNDIENPIKFLEQASDNFPSKRMGKIYAKLNKEFKESSAVIKSLFKRRDEFEMTLTFIKEIPDESLSGRLCVAIENSEMAGSENKMSAVGQLLEKIVDAYYMEKHLENIPASSSNFVKKSNKI